MNIAVTGINGFVGHHLARVLAESGHQVLGIGRQTEPSAQIKDYISGYQDCDLTNSDDVANLPFDSIDAFINLAGLAAVGKSFAEPEAYMDINVKVLSVMCEQIRSIGLKNLRLVAISTGAVYGSSQPMPLTEESKVTPDSSPYAASKLAMEQVALEFRRHGQDIVIARPFNHIGPGQDTGFLLPDLFLKLKTSSGEIRVGNLETRRDYTDVRDVAQAYMALATTPQLNHDMYNVCSGRAVSGTELLEELKIACGKADIKAVIDKGLFRPSDAPELYGDNSRISAETGWKPSIPLPQTVRDFVKSSPQA